MPPAFLEISKMPGGSRDTGMIRADPKDFNHILVGMRYTPDAKFGFLESTDGGKTFVVHNWGEIPFGGHTPGLYFLENPKKNKELPRPGSPPMNIPATGSPKTPEKHGPA